jgi:hypothetical protein
MHPSVTEHLSVPVHPSVPVHLSVTEHPSVPVHPSIPEHPSLPEHLSIRADVGGIVNRRGISYPASTIGVFVSGYGPVTVTEVKRRDGGLFGFLREHLTHDGTNARVDCLGESRCDGF